MARTVVQNRVVKSVKAAPREEVESEVETKEDAGVTVSAELAQLCTNWKTAWGKAESFFPRICKYVIDNDIGRQEMKKALTDFRGLVGAQLANELTDIFRLKEHPQGEEMIDATIAGEENPETGKARTVRELRKFGVKKQAGTEDKKPEDKLHILLRKAAVYAIKEVEIEEQAEFIGAARDAWKEMKAEIEGSKKKTQATAAAEEETEGEFEEEAEEMA